MTTTDAPRRGRRSAASQNGSAEFDLAALLANPEVVAALNAARKPAPLQREQHEGTYIHETTRADGKKLRRVMSPRPFLFGLRFVREKRALTQVQLATAASVDPLTVSRLENQRNPASAPTKYRLSRVLNVDPRVLEKQEGDITEADLPTMTPPNEPRAGF